MAMRVPGFEPELRAWEAPVITTTLYPPVLGIFFVIIIISAIFCFRKIKKGGCQYIPLSFMASATLFIDTVYAAVLGSILYFSDAFSTS